jgi:hypothetical protein
MSPTWKLFISTTVEQITMFPTRHTSSASHFTKWTENKSLHPPESKFNPLYEYPIPTAHEFKMHSWEYFKHKTTGQLLRNSPDLCKVYKQIAEKLEDQVFIDSALDHLEWELLKQSLKQLVAHASERPDGSKAKPKSLLGQVLSEVEAKNGFGKLAYMYGTSGSGFLANLRARRPFKDYNGGRSHGDHTHRIQWWIICERILDLSPSNAGFYAEIADWSATYLMDTPNQMTGVPNTKEVELWDWVCDHAGNALGDSAVRATAHARNPGWLWRRCLDRTKNRELLSNYCEQRHSKVATAFAVTDTVVYKDLYKQHLSHNGSLLVAGANYGFVQRILNKIRKGMQLPDKMFCDLTAPQQEALLKYVHCILLGGGITDKHGNFFDG